MKKILPLPVILLLALNAFSQSKNNDTISKQIKSLKAEKTFSLTYDKGSGMSKLMATSDNFSDSDAKKAGVQAMSFGMAFFYQGQSLTAAADPIAITFWVMTKKPRFSGSHKWTAIVGAETIDLGDAQYAARAGESMEYLNFNISRDNLKKIAAAGEVTIKLGPTDFQFTPAHLKLFKDILALSDPVQ